jgi:hypothetical protein
LKATEDRSRIRSKIQQTSCPPPPPSPTHGDPGTTGGQLFLSQENQSSPLHIKSLYYKVPNIFKEVKKIISVLTSFRSATPVSSLPSAKTFPNKLLGWTLPWIFGVRNEELKKYSCFQQKEELQQKQVEI